MNIGTINFPARACLTINVVLHAGCVIDQLVKGLCSTSRSATPNGRGTAIVSQRANDIGERSVWRLKLQVGLNDVSTYQSDVATNHGFYDHKGRAAFLSDFRVELSFHLPVLG